MFSAHKTHVFLNKSLVLQLKNKKNTFDLPGTPNNNFSMDVWFNNHFPCKDLAHHPIDNHLLNMFVVQSDTFPCQHMTRRIRALQQRKQVPCLGWRYPWLWTNAGDPWDGWLAASCLTPPWSYPPFKRGYEADIPNKYPRDTSSRCIWD